jgi:hypothetical protein
MVAEMVLIGIVLLLSPQVVPPMVYVLLAALALRGVMGYQTLRKAI